jgi:hypothetical protein
VALLRMKVRTPSCASRPSRLRRMPVRATYRPRSIIPTRRPRRPQRARHGPRRVRVETSSRRGRTSSAAAPLWSTTVITTTVHQAIRATRLRAQRVRATTSTYRRTTQSSVEAIKAKHASRRSGRPMRRRFTPFNDRLDGKLGSVYTLLTELLMERGDWRVLQNAVRDRERIKLPRSFDLLLGTAQGKGIPWQYFGAAGELLWPIRVADEQSFACEHATASGGSLPRRLAARHASRAAGPDVRARASVVASAGDLCLRPADARPATGRLLDFISNYPNPPTPVNAYGPPRPPRPHHRSSTTTPSSTWANPPSTTPIAPASSPSGNLSPPASHCATHTTQGAAPAKKISISSTSATSGSPVPSK